MLHDWIISNTEEFPEVGGLYHDGVLVYTFDDWLFGDRLYFSEDGMSFLVIPPRPWGFIRFYHMGELIRNHCLQSHLPYGEAFLGEVDQFGSIQPWRIHEKTNHDRANNTLSITTMQGDEIIFDLTNGVIVSRSRVFDPAAAQHGRNIWMAFIIGLGGLAAVGIAAFAFLKWNKKNFSR